MRTIVYIDGYNLYYGCLKYTKYKWLDVSKLFTNIIKIQSPYSVIQNIKYFTADIKTKMASQGHKAQQAQNSYQRAMELKSNKIDIIKGYYSLERAKLPRYKKPPSKKDAIEVWRLEEKQTDVNIALHAYRDATKKLCDQIVIVSNDSDLEPLLKMIREEMAETIEIGIIIPIRKSKDGKSHRPPNNSLSNYANWTRQHILEEELKNSQFADKIPTKKKPIIKPDYW